MCLVRVYHVRMRDFLFAVFFLFREGSQGGMLVFGNSAMDWILGK